MVQTLKIKSLINEGGGWLGAPSSQVAEDYCRGQSTVWGVIVSSDELKLVKNS